ncbi:IPT/TIG domain-containing protein [Actinoplanes teichomyceticus]|uniref:IPT/TIG domain-containing protein n=1 Tax=Actinoplanes teichomyceticus TaxID=1867 RepID=UPI000F0A6579|nr:IPT/TIG domain-containing protein [Actinoplanes teichomyceticus]
MTAAAAVVGIATPAWAVTLTTSTTQVPTAGGLTLTLTGTGAFPLAGSTFVGRFVGGTNPACGTGPAAPSLTATNPVVNAGTITAGLDANTSSIVTPALPAGAWRVCIYETVTGTGAVNVHSTAGTVLAVPFGQQSPLTGVTTGGPVTLTAPGAFTTTTTVGGLFTTAVCPERYAAAAAGTVFQATGTRTSSNAVTITAPATLTAGTGYYVCAYSGTTVGTSALAARSWGTYSAYPATGTGALVAPTITPPNGSSGQGGYVTLSAPTGTFPGTYTYGAVFSRFACPATYITASTGDAFISTANPAVQEITTAKVAVAVPTEVTSGAGDPTTSYNVCLYRGNTGVAGDTLIVAPATYTVAPVLSVANVTNTLNNATSGGATGPNVNALGHPSIQPASGPAQGGTTVTIENLTGIPTAEGALLQASLGGSNLTNVRALSSTSLTGVTTAHGAGFVNLSVTTAAGTRTTLFTTTTAGAFRYTYGVNVTPNTAAPGVVQTVDITGAGFTGLTFEDLTTTGAGTTPLTTAHVVLTDNNWYALNNTALTGAGLANAFPVLGATAAPPIAQCRNVLPISDTELICNLDLANTVVGHATAPTITAGNVPYGTYQITVLNQGGGTGSGLQASASNYSVVSSGSTFTVADF